MRVLIVDDEPQTLLLCRVTLEFEGHEVQAVAGADEAEGLAGLEQPDLIVLGASSERDKIHELARAWGIPVLALPIGQVALNEAVRRVSWRAAYSRGRIVA